MRRIPWMRTTLIALCASLALTAPAAALPHEGTGSPGTGPGSASPTTVPPGTGHAPARGVSKEQVDTAREAQRYWTPERIRAAVPVDASHSGKADTQSPPGPGQRRKRSLANEPSRQVPEGIATVGVFLIRTTDGSATPDQFCTASAVASPTKSLVITAGHCLTGNHHRDFAFVPGYRTGTSTAGQAGEAPYGIFPAQEGKAWVDARYRASTPDDDVDFAFLSVGPNARGQLLEDAVGRGNELTSVPTAKLARKAVTLVGYPGQKIPLQCTHDTTAFQGRFMEIKCEGFRTGVSGGPFLENFDGRRGDLIGIIGGYKTGGPYDHTSYTSQFDEDVFRLYRQAVTGMPSNPGPGKAGASMGSADTWTHARAMTTGRFHTASVRDDVSDLIVRWSDGELSLYPGNGAYGFGKDIQLVKDKAWQQAAVITAGDFTGDANYDLLVRWTDGRLTLYKDVNESRKLRDKVELKGPNDTWTHASTMTAGRFGGGNTRSDDLIVTRTDGEVTLYTNVDAKGLHAQKQLVKPPNTTWPHARDIAAGDFRPATGDQDLFVRWSDGEVTAYENIAAEGFGREHPLLPAKSPWREVLLATTGTFGGPARQNDLVALWPGGKLTLHPDTTSAALPAERILVSP